MNINACFFKMLKNLSYISVGLLLMLANSAHAVLITFDELDASSLVDANGDRIPLTNEYESQGLIFSDLAYLDGGVAGPGFGFKFIGENLPTFISFNLGASGIATSIDVRGPGYRKTITSSGEIVGMTDEVGTPFIPYELFSFSSATGISSVEFTSKAGVSFDNLTFNYSEISVPEPSTIILFVIGLLGLFGSHVRSRLSQSK